MRDDTEVRDLSTGEARYNELGAEDRALTDAITLAPTAIGTVLFDRLRAAPVMLRTGLRTIGIDGKAQTFPTVTGDVSPSMTSETGTIAPNDPTFASVTATARKLTQMTVLSNEVVDDSTPAIVPTLNDHFLKLQSLKLDLELLEGSGTPPEIKGLKNVSGTQPYVAATNGASVTWDMILDMVALFDTIGVPRERLAIVEHPQPRDAAEVALGRQR